MTVETFITFE